MLGDDLHGKVVVVDIDVFGGPHPLYKTVLDFPETGVVGVVEDAEFRVASLSVKIKTAVLLFVEANTPSNQFPDLFRSARTTFSTASRSESQSPAIIVSSICLSKLSTLRSVTEATPPGRVRCWPPRAWSCRSQPRVCPGGGLEREAHACDSGPITR